MGKKGVTSNVPPAGSSASDVTETCKNIASESPGTGPDPPEVQESENIATPGIEGENRDGSDGNSSYTVTVNMLGGKTTKLHLSHGDTVMEVRQHLQKILGCDAFTSYTLQLRDKKDDSVRRLEHYDTISDVANISTGEFQLEMVPESFDYQSSIMTNVHHTGEFLSHSSLHSTVSSSLERNTSSNLKDGNDRNSSYTVIVEMLSGETTKLQGEMGEKGESSNVPPAGSFASDVTETCKHIASESPGTGPDPPEVQEPENIAIEGPNGGDGPNEDDELFTVRVKMFNGDMITLQLRIKDTAQKLREYLQDIVEMSVPISYTLWLYEEDIRTDYCVDLGEVVYDVADFSTEQYYLGMVEETFEGQSIMANDHHTGELLSHSSLHSSVARNTSSNLEENADRAENAEATGLIGVLTNGNDESHYEENEIVLAYWNQGIYPAKVLKTYLFKHTWPRYYIAYLEKDPNLKKQKKVRRKKDDLWKDYIEIDEGDYWREWVTEKRLLKVNPENLKAMKVKDRKLANAAKRSDPKKLWIVDPKLSEAKDPMLKIAENFKKRFGFEIFPNLLMAYIQDREISLHLGEIMEDHVITVEQMINNFIHHLQEKYFVAAAEVEQELIDGYDPLQVYFDLHLGELLYKTEVNVEAERNQEAGAVRPSRKYGGEHLLRLLVNLHKFVDVGPKPGNGEVDNRPLFVIHLEKLLGYIEENIFVPGGNLLVHGGDQEKEVVAGEIFSQGDQEEEVVAGEIFSQGDQEEEVVAALPRSMVVDESLPVTSIQIRLADGYGDHPKVRFNLHQTVGDIRSFIDTYTPGPLTTYQLVAGGTNHRVLTDPTETIEEAGLADWAVIQKY